MKQRIEHNGIYHCPECCIEYELEQEPCLKCEDCDDTLQPGPLGLKPDGDEDYGDEA